MIRGGSEGRKRVRLRSWVWNHPVLETNRSYTNLLKLDESTFLGLVLLSFNPSPFWMFSYYFSWGVPDKTQDTQTWISDEQQKFLKSKHVPWNICIFLCSSGNPSFSPLPFPGLPTVIQGTCWKWGWEVALCHHTAQVCKCCSRVPLYQQINGIIFQ